MDTPQGTCCIQLSRRKKCLTCRRAHDRKRQALRREKLKPQIKATRSNVAKKRSIYAHVLCDLCKDKSTTKYCNECIPKYKHMTYINRKRKSCAVENKENSVNKAIIGTNTQSGSDIGGNIGSDDSGLGNAVNISCSVKKSNYANVLENNFILKIYFTI